MAEFLSSGKEGPLKVYCALTGITGVLPFAMKYRNNKMKFVFSILAKGEEEFLSSV